MRYQVAAGEVVRRLVTRNLLQPKQAAEVRALVEADEAGQAFRACRAALTKVPFGWNKFWEGTTLYGWYGETVSAEPLRLAALEVEADVQTADEVRRYLTERYEGKNPEQPTDGTARLLGELGITLSAWKLGSADLNLLRKLNLDQREQPFIERWRWSGGSGYATLSDEGRLQIKPELVWTRAIEGAMDESGVLPEEIGAALASFDAESRFMALHLCSAAERMIEKMAFFGFGERWEGGVNLVSTAGNIPREIGMMVFTAD